MMMICCNLFFVLQSCRPAWFGAIEIAPGTTDPTLSHSVIKVHFMTLPKRKKMHGYTSAQKEIKSLPKEKNKLEQCKKHKFNTTPHSTRLFTGTLV